MPSYSTCSSSHSSSSSTRISYRIKHCIHHAVSIVSSLMRALDWNTNRLWIHFRFSIRREIEACYHLLGSLCSCTEQLMIIRSASEYGSLFPSGEHKAEGLFNTSANVNQYSFYGRCLGFHVSIFSFSCSLTLVWLIHVDCPKHQYASR